MKVNKNQLYFNIIIFILIQMPRVWLAIFFGYNGKNFSGLQLQKEQNVRTVQNQLITILFKGGLLQTDNYYDLVKTYKWGRAARTDKGVHAVCNSVSSLFLINQRFYDETKNLKKNQLWVYFRQIFESTEIMFHCFKKVTTRFDSRQMVKSRVYHYLCPWSFFKENEGGKNQTEEAVLEKINECCRMMIGSHNFHNYSKGLKAKEPQARRYMINFKCEKVDNYAKFIVTGQSFVYHQIRKMIGIIIEIFMHDYDPTYIANTFYNNQVHVLLAPPHGLYLNKLNYDSYNKKQEIPEKIEFSQEEQLLNDFQKIIEKHIQELGMKIWRDWHKSIMEKREEFSSQEEEEVQHEG